MYTLRFPFRLPLGREIRITNQSFELEGLTGSIEGENHQYVMKISGFASEDLAKAFISNLWAGLMWVLLRYGLSPDMILETQNVQYPDDPYQAAKKLSKTFGCEIEGRVDGLIDGDRPAIYLTDRHMRALKTGQANIGITSSSDHIIRTFQEAVAFPECASIIEDPKLRVALELFGAYFTESSVNARFLALVMSLEALSTGVLKTKLVLDLIEKWKMEAEEMQDKFSPDSDDFSSLEAIAREVSVRKEDSIRRQIRNLVHDTLQSNEDKDAKDLARRAVQIYDLRSRLVHDGQVDSHELDGAVAEIKNIVERVLRARFVHIAKTNRQN
jgi:hypothetical protein